MFFVLPDEAEVVAAEEALREVLVELEMVVEVVVEFEDVVEFDEELLTAPMLKSPIRPSMALITSPTNAFPAVSVPPAEMVATPLRICERTELPEEPVAAAVAFATPLMTSATILTGEMLPVAIPATPLITSERTLSMELPVELVATLVRVLMTFETTLSSVLLLLSSVAVEICLTTLLTRLL